MPRVYISPSVQGWNPCRYGDSEKNHCQLYADILERYFQACGIEFRRNRDQTFQQAVAESNAWGPDLHYACHTNAYNELTRYSVLLVYSAAPTDPAYLCAEQIKRFRAQIYPNPIYVNQNRQLYEIRYSAAPCVYDEMAFHDNVDDATLFHVRMQSFAETTTRGFCDYFGIPFVPPEGVGLEPGLPDTGPLPPGAGADAVPAVAQASAACDELRQRYEAARQELDALRARYAALKNEAAGLAERY